MKPRLTFSIGADSRTHLYFKVIIWRTQDDLQAVRNTLRPRNEMPKLCDGFCHRFQNRSCDDKCIGEIHFCADRLEISTIAHECVHAAVGYAEWIRPSDNDASADSRDLVSANEAVDECIAYSAGFMTEGIIWNIRREKLKVKPVDKTDKRPQSRPSKT